MALFLGGRQSEDGRVTTLDAVGELPDAVLPCVVGPLGEVSGTRAPALAPEAVARAVADTPPFLGHVRIERVHSVGWTGGTDVVVAIPAKDEEVTLPACLDSVGASLRYGTGGGIIVIVNNTADRSGELAAAWARTASVPVLICEVTFAEMIADIGHVRRFAMDCAAALVEPGGVILSTDADTIVSIDWADRLSRAAAVSGLAYGPITTDDAALAFGPEAVRIAELEEALRSAQARLWALLAPRHTLRIGIAVGGANMGASLTAYRAVGGLPPLVTDEDRAFTDKVLNAGFDAVRVDEAGVVTSCRLVSRVVGGMAATLSARLAGHCECDRTVLPIRRFALLALTWRLLADEDDSATALALCRRLGLPPAALQPSSRPPSARLADLRARLAPCPALGVAAAEHELVRANALHAMVAAAGPAATIEHLVLCVDALDA